MNNSAKAEFLVDSESDAFLFSGSINDHLAGRFINLIRDKSTRSEKVALFLTTFVHLRPGAPEQE